MVKKHTADDDSESQKRTDVRSPEVCVDYLSYKFDEMDLAASWRVMTKQKKDIVNGIRLENASWRTWAKQRSHLKTISPETLNWLKDSDVTWLYGPLHTVIKSEENDRYAPSENKSSTHDKLGLIHASESLLTENKNINNNNSNGITTPPPPTTSTSIIPPTTSLLPSLEDHVTPPSSSSSKPLKSALKRVTMSDILRRSASELLFDKEYAHQNQQDDHDHTILPTSSSSISLSEANRKVGAFSPSIIATHRQPKLRFNQRVEQYMVISDDDGNSSHNGSLPKVKMTANVSSMFDHHHDRRDSTSSVNSDTTNNTDDDIYNSNKNYNHNHQSHNHNTTTASSSSSSVLIKEKK
ncbi:hypothetical protein BJ944DRAFT_1486 [Cunninghamella echinulata]|nr:hypothetical protein BJ944DRAFT_1486 [Cunninghamella echinulata]